VLGFLSKRGKLLLEISNRMRCPVFKKVIDRDIQQVLAVLGLKVLHVTFVTVKRGGMGRKCKQEKGCCTHPVPVVSKLETIAAAAFRKL
jgi:hypothetical protein